LNVDTDLQFFDAIVPCGIREYGVTSIARALRTPIEMSEVCDVVADAFAQTFELSLRPAPAHGIVTP
jgi:lipoyl(octanoyl) transferase